MPRLTKRSVDALEPREVEAFAWDADVKGFGVRVKPSGVKSFVLKYRVGSKTRRHTISKVGSPFTVEQARERALALLRGLHDGIDPAEAKAADRTAVTVAELVDAYLLEGPALKPNKKSSSWATDRSVLTRHVKPLLGRKLAERLTKDEVVRFQADVAAGKTATDERTKARGRAIVSGGKRAASLSTAILRAMLQFGVETGRLKENPARGVELFRSETKERFLTEIEVALMADAIAGLEEETAINSSMADAIRVLLISGARKAEITGLQWDWVDFGRSCLRLPDSKTGQKVIPLASPALAILAEREKLRGKELFVFPAARGEGHTVGLAKAWAKIKSRATALGQKDAEDRGDDPARAPNLSDVRPHDLRHSFASFAVADGAPLFMVGKVLGHRQARTTEIYAHLSQDPIQAVAERTGARIAEAMKPRKREPNLQEDTSEPKS